MLSAIDRAENSAKNDGKLPLAKPGVDEFTVIDAVGKLTGTKQTPSVEVLFQNSRCQFKHSYFLTPKALPRLVSLLEDFGVESVEMARMAYRPDELSNKENRTPEENLQVASYMAEDIVTAAKNRTVRLRVVGKEVERTIDGTTRVVVNPDLEYSNFSEKVNANPSRLSPELTVIKLATPTAAIATPAAIEKGNDLPF
jgi:hypothetical protein